MRYFVCNDLHINLYPKADKTLSYFPKADGIIIAGDLCSYIDMPIYFDMLCRMYPKVVYISGNHDLYGVYPQEVDDFRKNHGFHNLVWLENDFVIIGNTKVCGTTMWFPKTKTTEQLRNQFHDFEYIKGIGDYPYEANTRAMEFLSMEATDGAVVITHHLPTVESVDRIHLLDPFNCFFLCPEAADLAYDRKLTWIHGHTHRVLDYQYGRSRVLCNALGIPSDMMRMNTKLFLEL